MATRKRALLITFHNWEGRRQGGFHKLAEALCASGRDVGFLSFPRPWYGALKRSERLNARRLYEQVLGREFSVQGGRLLNFTIPTFGVPGPLRKYFGENLSLRLDVTSLPGAARYCRSRYPGADLIIFESTQAVLLFEEFRRNFPDAQIVYRPSDPLAGHPRCGVFLLEAERRMLTQADLVLLVDESARTVYRKAFPGLNLDEPRFQLVANGLDLQSYRSPSPRPVVFPAVGMVALYVGAQSPEWQLLLRVARELPACRVVVVCPERPPAAVLQEMSALTNCTYIPGVLPAAVAPLTVNCDAVLVPYTAGRYDTLGLTAKMLQAMAARKPIIARNVDTALRQYGIKVCDTDDDFIAGVRDSLAEGARTYPVDLRVFDWGLIQARFLSLVDRASTAGARPVVHER